MRTLKLAAAALAVAVAAPAFAQDAPPAAPVETGPTAPDGSRAFGIEPYVGVMGGWEQFDNERNHGIPQALNANGSLRNNYRLAGALVQGVAGINVPLGPVFVGAEGSVAKGVSGNIDWEYGAAGRFGVRAGDSGMFYGKVGYQWVDFDKFPAYTTGNRNDKNYGAITYGIGTEFGPKDIGLKGITGNAGFRIRAEVNTFGNFHSLRPMLGVITHF
ncbi:outer membrane protein [Sphingomonas glacialis]|uniref:Opacity protein n=1 Tax=Sphingomonas glacialis TaxID=658225 RepID=A0A502G301_9SPHN|nr:opacity protein [Sphingomonas glacialis]TPG56258.1 opacity protein [Sphingomonas glacialis]